MYENLGLTISILKKQKGLTNETLAQKSGVPKPTVERIASGKTKDPKAQTLKKIAAALDCTVDDLVKEVEPQQPYYLNEETAKIAQELYDNKDLKILFDASRHLTPEDIQAVSDIVNRIRQCKDH